MLLYESNRHTDKSFDRNGLLASVLERFRLNPAGIHGVSHWARVRYHGLRIGRARDADLLLVELFAFLHDACRHDDYSDPHHGLRAVEFAAEMNGTHFILNDIQLSQLSIALEGHSDGATHSDATIQTCWDADRLDLVRLSITPHPKFLSDEAVNHIDRAWELWAGRYRAPALAD